MKDLSVEDLCKKYPQYDSEIRKAYVAVLSNPDRDLEAELSGLDIDEEDIWGLITNINKTLWGESKKNNSVKTISEAILNGADIRSSIFEATINNLKFALENWFEDWIIVKDGDNQVKIDADFVDIPCEIFMSINGDQVSVTVTAKVDNQPYTITEKASFKSKEDIKKAVDTAYNKVKEQFLASKDED